AEPPAEPPVRAANWALSEYALRACADLIALTGDVVTSRVLVELVLAGTRAAPVDVVPSPDGGLARLGRPVRIAALAAALALPRETVRRHVAALETLGFCRREPQGVITALPAAMATPVVEMARANAGNVQRLFANLARTGALADWEG
ncbi:MAG: helix-turn-helix domain-containing protein, partial [Caulobacter sp.]